MGNGCPPYAEASAGGSTSSRLEARGRVSPIFCDTAIALGRVDICCLESACQQVKLEVRYARSFLRDLRNLEYAARERIYDFVFEEFMRIDSIQDLPAIRRVGSGGIFYRITVDNYLIGLEVTGNIVKFLRVLPRPDI